MLDNDYTHSNYTPLCFYSQTIGHAGDGYRNRPSPHTKKELFLGVEMKNATWVSGESKK